MTLVPIPWQPELKLTPSTLALLAAASERVGRDLYLYGAESAWRSYASQKAKWDAYQKGGAIASNPDTGQRSHMRGAAVDLRDTSTAVQKACRAVGLTRDPKEPWHWNDPNWRNMPIILADTSTAGLKPTPITPDRRRKKMMLFHTPNTGADKATYPLIFWLVAENGARSQFTSGSEFAAKVAGQLGNSIATDTQFLDIICKRLADSQPPAATVGKVTLDASALVAELRALGVKIDALPAEIDRYADGKKQSV